MRRLARKLMLQLGRRGVMLNAISVDNWFDGSNVLVGDATEKTRYKRRYPVNLARKGNE